MQRKYSEEIDLLILAIDKAKNIASKLALLEKLDVNKLNWENHLGLPLFHHFCYVGNILLVGHLLKMFPNIDINQPVTVKTGDGKIVSASPLSIVCGKKGNNYQSLSKFLLSKGASADKSLIPIKETAMNGHIEVIRKLIKEGVLVNQIKFSDSFTCLHLACENGDHNLVQLLIDAGADVEECTGTGFAPIQIACLRGHIDIVRILMDNKANVNKDRGGITALYIASQNNHKEVVSFLLEKCGANIEIADLETGFTPLHIAAKHGHTEIVGKLIKHNAGVIHKTTLKGSTAFYFACEEGHTDTVQLFINAGVNVNEAINGITPLYAACEEGRKDTVKLLIENGANTKLYGSSILHMVCAEGKIAIARLLIKEMQILSPCELDKDRFTPLHLACKSGQKEIIEFLVKECGVEIFKHAVDGITPFHAACEQDNDEIINFLIPYLYGFNQWGNDMLTPLHVACNKDKRKIIKLLIDEKICDVNCAIGSGFTPLIQSCSAGQEEVVSLLLACKADINQCNDEGFSALHFAYRSKNIKIMKLLISAKVDVNIASKKEGITVLHMACSDGNEEVVQLLIDSKADLDKPTNEEKNFPLHFACKHKHATLVKMLIKAGAEPNPSSEKGVTPLSMAWASQRNELCDFIINHDAKNKEVFLHSACEHGKHIKFIEYLLSKGLDLDKKINGVTAVFVACEKGHLQILKLLIDRGAIGKLTKDEKNALLFTACEKGQVAILEFLIDKGIMNDLNQKNKDKKTLFFIACATGRMEIVDLLLLKNKQIDINMLIEGTTALHVAAQHGHRDIVMRLLKLKAQVDKKNNKGLLAIHIAWNNNHDEIVNDLIAHNKHYLEKAFFIAAQSKQYGLVASLIKCGIDVDIRSSKGLSLLHLACKEDEIKLATLLLDMGASPDEREATEASRTPFYIACQKGHINMVKLLCERGADLNLLSNGISPLYIACQEGHEEIAAFLLEKKVLPDQKNTDDGFEPMDIAEKKKNKTLMNLLEKYGVPHREIKEEVKEEKKPKERPSSQAFFPARSSSPAVAKKHEIAKPAVMPRNYTFAGGVLQSNELKQVENGTNLFIYVPPDLVELAGKEYTSILEVPRNAASDNETGIKPIKNIRTAKVNFDLGGYLFSAVIKRELKQEHDANRLYGVKLKSDGEGEAGRATVIIFVRYGGHLDKQIKSLIASAKSGAIVSILPPKKNSLSMDHG